MTTQPPRDKRPRPSWNASIISVVGDQSVRRACQRAGLYTLRDVARRTAEELTTVHGFSNDEVTLLHAELAGDDRHDPIPFGAGFWNMVDMYVSDVLDDGCEGNPEHARKQLEEMLNRKFPDNASVQTLREESEARR